MIRPLLAATFFTGGVALVLPPVAEVVYTPYQDAKPILEAMSDILPAELRDTQPGRRERLWDSWVRARDAEIRSRLAQGDADSVVNLLMFGTSFTSAPRLTTPQLQTIAAAPSEDDKNQVAELWQAIFEKRAEDLVRGMTAPGSNERLLFARKTLERSGIEFAAAGHEQKARTYLLENVKRVLEEQSGFQQTLSAAKSLPPADALVERSKLYEKRGLSLDTSLPPNYALEVALSEMKTRGLLKPGSVKRVGIVGPGLDFTDKQEGFDFYPTQTVQPFALMDSLLRLKLASPTVLEVDALDLSPRVLEHIKHAKGAAETGRTYTIQLPRDPARGWNAPLIAYWNRFGEQIGSAAPTVTTPEALQDVALRAVRVRPEFVRRMNAYDVNIVLQRARLRAGARFDLLIATNILVYYGTFEQSLAMANIASMLNPGGYLLTNNALLELPSSEMRSLGYKTVVYSNRADDGDHIIWYQRKSNAPDAANAHLIGALGHRPEALDSSAIAFALRFKDDD